MTKRIEITREQVKTLVKIHGYSKVAEVLNERSESNLRARLNGHLRYNKEYQYRVLKALEELGTYKETNRLVKLAKKELSYYEN